MEKTETLAAYFAPKGYDSSCTLAANKIITALKEKGIHVREFPITPTETYPADKEKLMAVARIEKENHSRPELTGKCSGYEYVRRIILIVPNWFDSVPMGVMTFLEQYSNHGKRFIPVVLHGGDGANAIVKELRAALPKSDVMSAVEIDNNMLNATDPSGCHDACGCHNRLNQILEYLKEK